MSRLTLYRHQLDGLDLAVRTDACCGLFFEPGLGKTLTTYAIYDYLRSSNPDLKLVIVCPKSLIFTAWAEDHEKYFSKYKFVDFETYKKKQSAYDVLALNYEKLQTKAWAKYAMEILGDDILWACDESSFMRSYKTKTSKILLKIARYCKHRVILSGTPHPNGLHELWAQIQFIQPGIFPASFHSWRNTYFHLERQGEELFMRGKVLTRDMSRELFSKGWKWAITEANKEALMRKIAPYVIYRSLDDCVDLPEAMPPVIRKVEFTPEEKRLYKQMKRDLLVEVGGKMITAPLVLTKIMKLRQLTGGFIYDEEGLPHQTSTAKIREMLSFIKELGDKQCIIWGHFVPEMRAIIESIEKAGYTVATYYSETKRPNDEYLRFKTGDAQFLVANPQSCAHGLTLTNCHQELFYSLSYSYEQYYQASRRVRRISQDKRVIYTHLLVEKSIDEVLYSVIQRKGNDNEMAKQIVEELKR